LISALDKYCDIRRKKSHACSFNLKSYRGLNLESLLLLNNAGKSYRTIAASSNHEKFTSVHNKIKSIFIEANIDSKGERYTQICYNTYEARLLSNNFTEKECEIIQSGHIDKLTKTVKKQNCPK
jgi:hypothetical protein